MTTTPEPTTNEFPVGTHTDDFQNQPTVAALTGGGFVVVWSSQSTGIAGGNGFDVHAQLYDAAGNPVGGEFRINTFTANQHWQPAVTALEDGGFVVAWAGEPDANITAQLNARRFDATGTPVGDAFVVSDDHVVDAIQGVVPSMAELANGNLVVTWTARDVDTVSPSVFARVYDANGTALTGEVPVNTTLDGAQQHSSVAALPGGGFVVTWMSANAGGGSEGIFARIFNAAGDAVGGEFQIDDDTFDQRHVPSVTALDGGGFVVVWSRADNSSATGFDIAGRVFDASGAPVGGEFEINTFTTREQLLPSVTALDDGGFLVVWRSRQEGEASNPNFGIYGQRFDAMGAPVGDEFHVNQTIAGDQSFEAAGDRAVVQLDSGDLVVVWQSGLLGGFTDVYARIFSLSDDVTVIGSPDVIIDLSAITEVGGNLTITDNLNAVTIDISNLISVGGDLDLTGNTSVTVIDVSLLATVGGDLDLSGNTSATAIDASSLTDVGGDLIINGNTSVGELDLSSLLGVGGNLDLSGNTSATAIDAGSLTSVGGDLTISDNTSVGELDLSSLLGVGGNLDLTGNTSLTVIDAGSLTSVSGSMTVTGNDALTTVDASSLVSVGGDLTIEIAPDATAVNASALGPGGGEVVYTDDAEGEAIVTLGELSDMDGTLTITGADGVAIISEASLDEITTTGSDGDDNVTGSATAENTMDGGGGDDDLTGGAAADDIDGGEGNDTLAAGDGDDEVSGGAGDDTIVGGHGGGDDIYDGGADTDTVSYTSTTLGVVVDLAAGTASGPEIDSDTLIDIENVVGGAGDDRIGGNAAANVLAGGEGTDTAVFSGLRSDYTIEALATPGSYRVTDNRIGPNDGIDLVSDFELFEFSDGTIAEADILDEPPPVFNVIDGTPGNDRNLKGTAGADQINALAGHDIVDAKGGDDLIIAGAGHDLVNAGNGNDTVVAAVNDGNDLYYGDSGADTFDFSQTSAAATVSLGTTIFGHTLNGVGHATGAQIGTDALLSFENAIGGSGNDTITGDNLANVLSGGAGNDTISGLRGNDTLSGDDGNDRLIGGRGSDLMTGGLDADTFVFQASQSQAGDIDTIFDFAVGEDHLQLLGLAVNQLAELDVNGDSVLDTSLTLSGGAVVNLLGVNGANVPELLV
jgi:Ca2+-binding RTX toxin-like protein